MVLGTRRIRKEMPSGVEMNKICVTLSVRYFYVYCQTKHGYSMISHNITYVKPWTIPGWVPHSHGGNFDRPAVPGYTLLPARSWQQFNTKTQRIWDVNSTTQRHPMGPLMLNHHTLPQLPPPRTVPSGREKHCDGGVAAGSFILRC